MILHRLFGILTAKVTNIKNQTDSKESVFFLFCIINIYIVNTIFGDFLKDRIYMKVLAHRAVICFFIVMFLLLSCVLRVAVIVSGNYREVATEQSLYRINVSRIRGTIFDCNMVPLTNNSVKNIAAVSPTPSGIMNISSCTSGETLKCTLEVLKSNKPTVCEVNTVIEGDGISFTSIYSNDNSTNTACHLIGYTDDTGHGVSGLQKAYDDLLYSNDYISAVFNVGGTGNVLGGEEPYFENDYSVIARGVVSTIDINIQSIVEKYASQMNSGCVVVADAKNAKIRALASVPTFDINNLSESLNAENSPMINRALLSYSVGSVFKPCVAAAALQHDMGNYIFECVGNVEIADRLFKCHELLGHGKMNLCSALAESCNCFFYDFSSILGGDKIYYMSSTLNYGSKIKLCENIYTAKGNVPDKQSLTNKGALANLSIGQGELLLSPISILTLYLSIAGDGSYYLPSIVEKTINDGVEELYDIGKKTRSMSEKTAETLRDYLKSVISDGTGIEAAPTLTTAAGKTATAQTGRYYDDGTEITNSWFCGMFPADNPQYVIAVMSDSKINVSTASIFAQIADGIMLLNGNDVENAD